MSYRLFFYGLLVQSSLIKSYGENITALLKVAEILITVYLSNKHKLYTHIETNNVLVVQF